MGSEPWGGGEVGDPRLKVGIEADISVVLYVPDERSLVSIEHLVAVSQAELLRVGQSACVREQAVMRVEDVMHSKALQAGGLVIAFVAFTEPLARVRVRS